jgi:jumonji domain-containing protein 2
MPHRYVIPPVHRARFENFMKGLVPEAFKNCPEFLRHKVGGWESCGVA